MNAAAVSVMAEVPDIAVAYGISDEYRCVLMESSVLHVYRYSWVGSFVFRRECTLFERRERYSYMAVRSSEYIY